MEPEENKGVNGTSPVIHGVNLETIEGRHLYKVFKKEKIRKEEVCLTPNKEKESKGENTPKRGQSVSQSLEGDMEREALESPKLKKKSNREPSMASPVETRSSFKLDVGPQSKRGRRSEKQSREEETKRSLADGRQKTLLDCSLTAK